MRAIDADVLKEHIDKLPALPDGNFAGNHSALKALINMQPTIEQERKTGHWKEVYAETDYRNGWIEFSCEACEYQHGLESGEYGWHYGDPIPWKYCPMCGARMKEEGEG